MQPFLAALSLLLLGAGCSFFGLDDLGPNARTDDLAPMTDSTETMVLETGEAARLTLTDAQLRFVGKLEESRCPIGVTCIWEGEVVARLTLTPAGGAADTLDLKGYIAPDGDGTLTAATDGVEITLLRLDPYPVDGEPQGDKPDVATIRVRRR